MKILEARARRESKWREEDSWYIQHIFPWLGSTGCCQEASTALQQTQGHCHLPSVKPTAAQVVPLLPDHQASSRVRLKGIFPQNKILRPLLLRCLAEHCCHVFMAIAACRRWDPKKRQLGGCSVFVAQIGWGFVIQHLTGQCLLSSACNCPRESTALLSPPLASAATHPSHQWLGFGGICLQMRTRLENGLARIR